MLKPTILFVLSQKLGWSSYSASLQKAAEKRTDFRAVVRPYNRHRLVSSIAKKIHARGLARQLGIVDPMLLANAHLGPWWRLKGEAIRPDAIHTATQNIALPFARLARGIPLSVTIDCTRRCVHDDFGVDIFSAGEIAREQAVFSACTKVFSMTDWATQSVIQDYAIPPDKTVTLHPPVNIPHTISRKRPSGDRLPRIGFIGTDFRRKGGDRLVEWHQTHFRDRGELHIVSAKAPQAPLPNVTFYGSMPHDRITSEFLPGIDMFCFPTRQDMAAFVLAEAAAAGIPSIVYRVGGTADLVRDGQTGLVVEKGDEAAFVAAIGALIDNAELRCKLGDQAAAHARIHFDADKHFATLFDSVLSSIDRAGAAEQHIVHP